MNIEHCDCLSWFSRKSESHKQDGETLPAQRDCCKSLPASGDPAMAFEPSMDMDEPTVRRSFRQRCCRSYGRRLDALRREARGIAHANRSTANTQPFNQLFVTPLIRAAQIVEYLTPL